MARTGRGAIDGLEAAFIELQLHSQDSTAKKNALQRLCLLYRLGQRLRAPQHTVLLILGLLYDPDKKVVRWALNAAAFLVPADRVEAILEAIDRNRDDPDILGAGVAALAASNDEDRLRELLEARGLPLQGATLLAAAQKLPGLGVNLTASRINIDTASVSELRLATVLVGIEKAPEYMFDSDHPNSSVIGALNSYPDAVVAQYSIWAAMESKQLGLAHVRIPLSEVMAQRANVRAYIYRLLASDMTAARSNLDFLEEASQDGDAEARASLAKGLRDTYFDGVDELVVSWILDEDDALVREYLLEHMAAQCVHQTRYVPFVEQQYQDEAPGSAMRARLEVAARSTPLANVLGRIKFMGDNARYLPLGGASVNNNSFTFNGSAMGAFSGSGDASAGDLTALYQTQAPQMASIELEKLAELLKEDPGAGKDAQKQVLDASQAPNKSTVGKVLDWLEIAAAGGKLAKSTVVAMPGIVDALHKVIPHLPG